LLLLPIFLSSKEDFLTPILAVAAAFFSFYLISSSFPATMESGPATLSLNWTDNVKIDGAKLKGFAKTESGETFYVIYTFVDERQKREFLKVAIPSMRFTMVGAFREPDLPAHDFSFDMKKYMQMYGASEIFEADMLLAVEKQSGIRARLSEQRFRVKNILVRHFLKR
jgi:competence protein ComEC